MSIVKRELLPNSSDYLKKSFVPVESSRLDWKLVHSIIQPNYFISGMAIE